MRWEGEGEGTYRLLLSLGLLLCIWCAWGVVSWGRRALRGLVRVFGLPFCWVKVVLFVSVMVVDLAERG